MHPTDPHLFREDPTLRHRRIADVIAANPNACFSIALENLDRWQAWGRTHPAPLDQWRSLIHHAQQSPADLEPFLHFLRTADPDREPLLSCSPFVGLPETSTT